MLERSSSRQPLPVGRRRRDGARVLVATLVAAVLGLGAVYLLGSGAPEPRALPVTESELAARAAALVAESPVTTRTEKELARLGRALFHDPRMSKNGAVACSTCHDPSRSFTDGRPVGTGQDPTTKNAPTVVNTYLAHWFFWDGRADSLEAQALGPLEDPREHGTSRTAVVRHLMAHYEAQYTQLFGPFPAALKDGVPENALPRRPALSLKIDVAAYALATLGSFPIMTEILETAQRDRLAPAVELSKRALESAPHPAEWHAAWDALTPEARAAVDQVFANFGRAVAAFQRGLAAVQSPFDRFAARLRAGKSVADSLDTGFGQTELLGFKLFTGPGQCTLCHAGPGLSDQQFHNIGLAQGEGTLALAKTVDVGRAAGVLRAKADPFNCEGPYLKAEVSESCRELPYLDPDNFELIGAFKTPSLRNVAETAPYMHDGRFATLAEVLEHYNELAARPATGHREESLKPLAFAPEELAALEAFLRSLTSPVVDVNADETASNR